VTPELALRTGRRSGDFEAEQEHRREYLERLVAADVLDPGAVRTAILGYRLAAPAVGPSPHQH
jgi:hypothetical protein